MIIHCKHTTLLFCMSSQKYMLVNHCLRNSYSRDGALLDQLWKNCSVSDWSMLVSPLQTMFYFLFFFCKTFETSCRMFLQMIKVKSDINTIDIFVISDIDEHVWSQCNETECRVCCVCHCSDSAKHIISFVANIVLHHLIKKRVIFSAFSCCSFFCHTHIYKIIK